ncbi:serine/threonine-protein kinase [Luteipulveratus mongoliensis]|uniref:serine/threonine-protein kinase n=1 Tax=Luteipulveratus mongoliensis TaxID=571913 RepID=UPI0006981C4E|nr:serine/threonine-protein kinase [Luteipulveratus mongoliensis]
MSDRVGSRFGIYELQALLGRGGMGEVYRAWDTEKDRTVAIKLLPTRLGEDPSYRTRFEREARTAASVAHPHIVPIHTFGQIEGVLFIEMPLVTGTDLSKVLAKAGPFSLKRTVHIVEQIAGALDAAHRAGLTHRDVKPENILVTDDDFCYLADFGIASRADETRLTESAAVIGSWRYMAPERFSDQPATAAADTYALACVAYEMLAGTPAVPHQGRDAIVAAQLHDYPAPLPSPVTPQVNAVLRGGFDKDPAKRPAQTGELARQLRAAVPADGTTPRRWGALQWTAAVLAVLAVIGVGTTIGVRVLSDDAPESVVLLPADRTTGNPFTDTTVNQKPSDTLAQPYLRRDGTPSTSTPGGATTAGGATTPAAVGSVGGDTAGLYGVLDGAQPPCDTARLVAMITKDPARAKVWAGLLDTTVAKIPQTVARLTPVILRSDTLVTNSDYKHGKAVTYPAVLQAGTAVLVDDRGVPRVKCNCGNPLAQAAEAKLPTAITGTRWPGYTGHPVRVAPAKAAVASFGVTRLDTGASAPLRSGSPSASSTSSPTATAPSQPTDSIKRFNFGSATWRGQGLAPGGTVRLTRGMYTLPVPDQGVEYTWIPDPATTPVYSDLNGDGYLDAVTGLRVMRSPLGQPGTTQNDWFRSLHVWVWDPQKRTAVQITNPAQLAATDNCGSEIGQPTISAGTVTVSIGKRSAPCADVSRQEIWRVVLRGSQLVATQSPGGRALPAN